MAKTRILLLDNDSKFRDSLKNSLIIHGYDVVLSADRSDKKIDVVVSDHKVDENAALHAVPLILVGDGGTLSKPFAIEELKAAIEQALDEQQDFCRLGLQEFISGRAINFAIYIKLPPNKHVKVAHSGKEITLERVRHYRSKGLHYLYLRHEDFKKYVGLEKELTSDRKPMTKEALATKVDLLAQATVILKEQAHHTGVDQQAYETSVAFVEATLDIVTNYPDAIELLAALRSHADYLYPHSLGVSLYSVMIAQNAEWSLPTNKFKVALGGLFHDLGVKDLNKKLLEGASPLNVEEIISYHKHSIMGFEALQRFDGMPADVFEIVKQHHALSNPVAALLKKASVHPMAKLVAVADEFCYRVMKGPRGSIVEPLVALKDMKTNCSGQMDKQFFEALEELFK